MVQTHTFTIAIFSTAMQPFTITPVEPSHSEDILSLVCNEFCTNSPLHKAVGISAAEYREIISGCWNQYLQTGPVKPLAAIGLNQKKPLGCIIPARFPSVFEKQDSLSYKQRSIAALLSALEDQYLCTASVDNSLLVDIAVVHASARNQGIYQQMRSCLEHNAAEAGFKNIFGALSSEVTQNVCVEKCNQQVVAEIYYNDFVYKNHKPFDSISTARSIQLVKGTLGA